MAAPTNPLKNTASGYLTYRGREGQLAYLLHRLTGLGTLLFLVIHILDTSTVYFFPSLYEEAIALYRSTPFMVGEMGLVFSIIYHGVNGVRLAYIDLRNPVGWNIKGQVRGVRTTLAISVLIWLPAAGLMMYSMLLNNFGLFGG